MKSAPLLLFSLLGVSALAQAQAAPSSAVVKGTCDIASVGSNNKIEIKCGIGQQEAKKMLEIMNKILVNQIDPDAVMKKLDEILAASRPQQVVNSPNGIGAIDSTLINPTVNNNFAPAPQIKWTETDLDQKDGKGQAQIVLTVDHTAEVPAFGMLCDIPCHIVEVTMRATGIFSLKQTLGAPSNPNFTGFELAEPRPLGPGIPVVANIGSDDARTPHVTTVAFVSPEQLPR